jgi:hypothetical protein
MKIEGGRCVYVIHNPILKITKIGASDNPEKRKHDLELACGCELILCYSSKFLLCAEKYEIDAHNKFNAQRTMGEWFNITPERAIETIERIVQTATSDPVVELYRKGVPITKIAEEYEVTRQAILAKLKKYGVYDNTGKIYERDPTTVKPTRIGTATLEPKENKFLHISEVKDIDDDTMFLDEEKPTLPLKNLKRLETNINFNQEWYQVSFFRDGEFIYAYTKDLTKARAYVQGIRAIV